MQKLIYWTELKIKMGTVKVTQQEHFGFNKKNYVKMFHKDLSKTENHEDQSNPSEIMSSRCMYPTPITYNKKGTWSLCVSIVCIKGVVKTFFWLKSLTLILVKMSVE